MAYRELDELDPGIRDAVHRLRDAGFDTTDSGDGVSKPADWYESGEAMLFPHVSASLGRPILTTVTQGDIEHECERMREILGDGWVVQVSYATDSRSWVLFASKPKC